MQQQIIIDISPDKYFSPEIIEEATELQREIYFSRLVSKSAMTEAESNEYQNFLNEFITEDEEPVDNAFSEKNQKLLTRSLYNSWHPRGVDGNLRKFLATANVGLFTRLRPLINPVVPDVLVSLDVNGEQGNVSERQAQSYMVWEFGKLPEIVIEIVSNEIGDELGDKMRKYERIGVRYYVVFDPENYISDDVLQVFEMSGKGYQRRNDYVLPELNLRVCLWKGEFENWNCRWLRWLNERGELLLTGEELALVERNRAGKLAEKLRALDIDPNDV